MKTIHVVLAADENYVQHMGITILSLLYTIETNNFVAIYVIDDNLSTESRSILRNIVGGYNASISFLYVNNNIVKNLVVRHHLSRTAYYRLAIADILPVEIDKILYLDCDIIVRHDIAELWDIDISKYYAAAVADLGISGFDKKLHIRKNLGIPIDHPYFNSGVMLLNIRKWREERIGERVIQFIYNNPDKIVFCDQDGLNAVLWNNWLPLDVKWNTQSCLFRMYYKRKERRTLSLDKIDAIKDPHIVHFTEGTKPWHCICAIPYANEYKKYLIMTQWKDYRPSDNSTRNIMTRYRRIMRRRIKNLFIY